MVRVLELVIRSVIYCNDLLLDVDKFFNFCGWIEGCVKVSIVGFVLIEVIIMLL